MKIDNLVEKFKIDLEINNFSKDSIITYHNSLKIFSRYMQGVLSITDVEDIKPLHLKAFLKFNKERELKQKSLNRSNKKVVSVDQFRVIAELFLTLTVLNAIQMMK